MRFLETHRAFTPTEGKQVGTPSGDFVLARWVADYPAADTFIHSLLPTETGWEGKFCSNRDLDKIMESARRETDFTTRHSIYPANRGNLAAARACPALIPRTVLLLRTY